VTVSPLPGPSGNVEFFLWLRQAAPRVDAGTIAAVVSAGPPGVAGEKVTE
jgi:23S rRNA (cytidine1920-2'-O)/16S rRNA (cytidine1409-2'-O)-methyltransferase